MNISLSEASAYKLWKRLVGLHNNASEVPRHAISILIRKYLATNSHFVGNGRSSLSWKVMIKINLTDLIVVLMSRNFTESIDERHFHRLWQMIHFENMAVFFEKVFELVDENALVNGHLLSSWSMYNALCAVAKFNRTASDLQLGSLHSICYFYCGTSPGFLHKHEAILLLQDLCRDWQVIHERMFNFCDPQSTGSVSLATLKARFPVLIGDGLRLKFIRQDAADPIQRSEFIAFLQSELPAFICNDARVSPLV